MEYSLDIFIKGMICQYLNSICFMGNGFENCQQHTFRSRMLLLIAITLKTFEKFTSLALQCARSIIFIYSFFSQQSA